jgi:hypothetical protein
MQNSFAKPLDKSFVDFFAKIGMQSPFAKPLELLITSQVDERWTAYGNGEDRVGVETLAARHR